MITEEQMNVARPLPERKAGVLALTFRLDRGHIIYRKTEDQAAVRVKPLVHDNGRRVVVFRLGTRWYRVWADTLRLYLAHGVWDPFPEHLDGKPGNDGLTNIRVSGSRERQKRTSGAYKNPNSDGLDNAWRAQISVQTANGASTEVHLGTYATREEAHAAYLGAKTYRAAQAASLGFTVNRKGRKILATRNATGYAGVYFDAKRNRFGLRSRLVDTDNKPRHIGYYPTAEEAGAAYIQWLRVNGNDQAKELIRTGLM